MRFRRYYIYGAFIFIFIVFLISLNLNELEYSQGFIRSISGINIHNYVEPPLCSGCPGMNYFYKIYFCFNNFIFER